MQGGEILRTIKVEIVSASALPKVGKFYKQEPKPAVTITVDDQTWTTRISSTGRSSNPQWSDESFIILQRSSSKIDIIVRHKDAKDAIVRFSGPFAEQWNRAINNGNTVDVTLEAPLPTKTPGKGLQSDEYPSLRITLTEIVTTEPTQLSVEEVIKRAKCETATLTSVPLAPDLADAADIGKSLQALVGKVKVFKGVVDTLSKVHPYADTAWKVISAVYHVMEKQEKCDTNVQELLSPMHSLYDFMAATEDLKKIKYFQDNVDSISRTTSACGVFIHWYTQNSFLGRVTRDLLSTKTNDQITEFQKQFADLEAKLNTSLSAQIANDVQSLPVQLTNIVQSIPSTIGDPILTLPLHMHSWDSAKTCVDGTRTEFLDTLTAWALSPESTEKLFWLHGPAGSGKSSIATTLGQQFSAQQKLGAYFFFARGMAGQSTSEKVFSTLAHGLALYDPGIKAALAEAVKDPHLPTYHLARQFIALVLGPLAHCHKTEPVLIILDALDECDDYIHLLQALKTGINELGLPPFLRLLITSRMETRIKDDPTLGALCQTKEIDLGSQSNLKDIRCYIQNKLESLLTDEEEDKFLHLADGLFIWASTACEFIGSYPPALQEEPLYEILNPQQDGHHLTSLHRLYTMALESIYNKQLGKSLQLYSAFLGTIVVLRQSVTISVWAALVRMMDVKTRNPEKTLVPYFGCVIRGGGEIPLHVHHASFLDFVTNPDCCQSAHLLIQPRVQHGFVLKACLKVMEKTLQYDICGIKETCLLNSEVPDLEHHIQQHIPGELKYACQFWIDHCRLVEPTEAILGIVSQFLTRHFLHWMEAMSLMNKTDEAVKLLGSLSHWTMDLPETSHLDTLHVFVHDAYRFAQVFAVMIAQSALQIYHSALPLSPTESEIFKHFSKESTKTKVVMGSSQNWPAYLQSLEGHTEAITCVDVSAHGNRIVSGSKDHTLRIWDSESGGVVLGPLCGPTETVTSVCYSGNGLLIASGYANHTIIIWNAESGTHLSELQGHEYSISSMIFSTDSSTLVSASSERICLWDVKSAQPIWKWKNPYHSLRVPSYSGIFAVSISTNGLKVVACSGNMSVYVLNAQSGDLISEAWQTHRLSSVYMPPGACWVLSQTIQAGDHLCLWDVQSGTAVLVAKHYHSDRAYAAAVSHEGSKVAFGDRHSGDVYVKDAYAVDYASRDTRKGRTWHSITAVTFFPDGLKFVSGTEDGILRVWATESERNSPVVKPAAPAKSLPVWRNPRCIEQIAVAPDGSKIATSSADEQLTLWEPRSGEMILTHHNPLFGLLLFSCDGCKIVGVGLYGAGWRTTPRDTRLYLLDAKDGHAISEVVQSSTLGRVEVVAFSSDGLIIAAGTEKGICILWNTVTGKQTSDIMVPPNSRGSGDYQRLLRLAFVPNGSRISGASKSQQVHTWNTRSGVRLWMQNCSDRVLSMVSSSDGSKILACLGDSDRTILAWATESGQRLVSLPSGGPVASPEIPFQLELKRGWVWIRGKRVLWLPADYRFHNFTYAGGMLVKVDLNFYGGFIIIDLEHSEDDGS